MEILKVEPLCSSEIHLVLIASFHSPPNSLKVFSQTILSLQTENDPGVTITRGKFDPFGAGNMENIADG